MPSKRHTVTILAAVSLALTACQILAPEVSSPATGSERPTPSASDVVTTPAASAAATSIADVDGLTRGAFGEVVTTDLVLRSAPGISDASLIRGELNAPTRVYVEEGPVQSDGYDWFLVQVEGTEIRGWVAEAGKDGETWLERAHQPSSAMWTEVGSIDVGSQWGSVYGMTSFEGGYVAWGSHSTGDTPSSDLEFATWFSPDGSAWEMVVHSVPVAPCPGWTPRPNLESAYSAPTNGNTVVIVASLLDGPGRSACDQTQLVALHTTDGMNWDRSEPFGEGWSERSWRVPGGFEAQSNDGTIWRSVDGAPWTPAVSGGPPGFVNEPSEAPFIVGGADASGIRLAAWAGSLLTSSGTGPWREVTTLPEGAFIMQIVPPARETAPWVVTIGGPPTEDPYEARARVLTSTDLVNWDTGAGPAPAFAAISAMADGWLAIGYTPIGVVGCGDDCPTQDPRLYWTADALTWTELTASGEQTVGTAGLRSLATGPAGIFAVGRGPGHSVWRLSLD